MRQAEVLNLHWKIPASPPESGAWGVVHADQSKIVVHQSKNGERRSVPLVGAAAIELGKIEKRDDTTLVFPSATDPQKPMSMRTAFECAVRAAGIANFRYHDLRHCTASYLAMNGATMADIAGVLGHKTLAMAKRYSHLSESHVAGVLERMNERMLG
jgi:integrase